METDEILTIEEVAKLFRLSTQTVFRFVHEKKLRSLKLGNRLYRFSKAEVAKAMDGALAEPKRRRVRPNTKRDEQIASLKF